MDFSLECARKIPTFYYKLEIRVKADYKHLLMKIDSIKTDIQRKVLYQPKMHKFYSFIQWDFYMKMFF